MCREGGGLGDAAAHILPLPYTRPGWSTELHEVLPDSIPCIPLITETVLSKKSKISFFREMRHAYGRTALVLSGGGSFGFFHFGGWLVALEWAGLALGVRPPLICSHLPKANAPSVSLSPHSPCQSCGPCSTSTSCPASFRGAAPAPLVRGVPGCAVGARVARGSSPTPTKQSPTRMLPHPLKTHPRVEHHEHASRVDDGDAGGHLSRGH